MMRYVAILLMLIGATSSQAWTLDRQGDRYDLKVQDVPLSQILRRIEQIEGAQIRLFGDDDRRITATYKRVTLDQLLTRLGISYVLVYHQDASGAYALSDAMVLQGDEIPLDPEIRIAIMKWMRDMHHDDVYFNAHDAFYFVLEVGCDAVPFLEQTLFSHDYQARQLAAQALRGICPDYVPSDKLLDVTLDLLRRDQYDPSEYWSLFTPQNAYHFLLDQTGAFPRVRHRLEQNLSRPADAQERFLSALILAEYKQTHLAPTLVQILAPHLADNDLRTDGGAAAHAIYQLGPAVLPHLAPYRRSDDEQQAELAELIGRTLEAGDASYWRPRMYANYQINPLLERPRLRATYWRLDEFPDAQGRYHDLQPYRMTYDDYYGIGYSSYNIQHAPDPDSTSAQWDDDPFVFLAHNGETMHDISRLFAVRLEDIERHNAVRYDPDQPLPPGTMILIPSIW